ncbi:MAG: type II toxin-antitoxin system VapC family toxin [Terracidiphilus sp.]
MGVIFDTSIWIGLATSQISGQSVRRAAGDESVYISAISLGELNFGVESCNDPVKRILRVRFLRNYEQRPVLDVTARTASTFGFLAAFLKQTGRSPRTRVNDLWIAAQAIESDFALLTTNIKDFEGLPGLRVASV